MFVVVSYDIADDRRRNRIHRLMEGYGTRVQYSVFECDLSAAHLKQLRGKLKDLMAPREDSIRFYFLCADDVQRVLCLGGRPLARDPLLYLH